MFNMVKKSLPVAVFLMSLSAYGSPWEVKKNCQLYKYKPSGIYPQAVQELSELGLIFRVTQGLNQEVSPKNVHGADDVIDGVPYTAAVDISIQCLVGDKDIKEVLKALAESGFVGWYRKNGRDGWKGDDHIHAIWVKQKLKPSLVRQVNSWLQDKNGLKSNAVYQYWRPTEELKDIVKGYLK